LHGITSSARTWTPFLERLPDGIRAVAYDTPGNGYTELHRPRRPLTHEDRFRELIPSARVTLWDGVGHAPRIQAADRFGELLGEFVEATKENARPGGRKWAARIR
jgi:hypothetical protein